MVRQNMFKMLTMWATILAEIAVGLALASGALPIVLFNFVVPDMVLQIAGWLIVVSQLVTIARMMGLKL